MLAAQGEKLQPLQERVGVGYSILRRLLGREIDEEALGFIEGEDEIFPGINKHNFRHREIGTYRNEVKKRRVLGIFRNDCKSLYVRLFS